jgi:hypothetical protein
MTARKRVSKREREARAEPTTVEQQQADGRILPSESQRARVWELHLRGIPKTRIARTVGIHYETVRKIIRSCYGEIAEERKLTTARKLDGAVARWRLVQEQAWLDHDEDDARERLVLEMSLVGGNLVELAKDAGVEGADVPSVAPSGGRKPRDSNAPVRFQSQRSQYLRIILDAEKEIARLEGLYEGILDVDGAVGFVVIRREQSSQSEDSPKGQSGQIATSAPNTMLPAPADTSPDGVA